MRGRSLGVLSQPRLDGAPKVTQQDLQNNSDHSWRVKADRYWMHEGHTCSQQ